MDTLKELFAELKAKFGGKTEQKPEPVITTVATQYEINLVPEVKLQAIRALKLRNLVLYICIMVSVISIGAVLILFSVKSGQDIAMSNQDKKLATLSAKLMDYEELGDLVTIQAQLDKLSQIADKKVMLSRVFGALDVMRPQGNDVVSFSDLRVNLIDNSIRLEAQADARVAPLIDYRVLESFKKSVDLTKYDYGRYVDMNDNEIPTWCIKEADENGMAYRTGESYYAWWDLTAEGCAAVAQGAVTDDENEAEFVYNKDAEVETAVVETPPETVEGDGTAPTPETVVTRVKIWRTPQFTEWLNNGYMELNGQISGVSHFVSSCTHYSGATQSTGTVRWTSTNDCMLAPDGLTVVSSSNGRDATDNLVLKFTATANIAEEFFMFGNKHMIAIGPMGQNVTDSYLQIGNMFAQEARECEPGDTECLTNATNTQGSR